MNNREFLINLRLSKNEKDVENCYRSYFNSEISKISKNDKTVGTIVSPYGTDGHFKYKNDKYKTNINCLFEFKYDVNLLNKSELSKVLIQVLYYLKKFELNGDINVPTTVMVGDINECFIIHTNSLLKYLGYNIDWSIAPSQAALHHSNKNLLIDIIRDDSINPHIINVDDNFIGKDVLSVINKISKDNKVKIRITPQNVHIIFRSFEEKLFEKNVLNPNDSVNLFVQCLVDRENNYLHPHKKNLLVTNFFGTLKINGDRYNAFMDYFDVNLSPSEKETLTSIQDRLIQDETRRRKGEFFTPTPWVDEAHKMISEVFGEDWKDRYIVWDPAAGTSNLTRDYKFKELYLSTLNQSDIDTINQMGYNSEAVKFQYDFLNDGIKDGIIDVANDVKLPDGLKKAILDGKEIIVFMNPPYATSSNLNFDEDDTKSNVAKTNINEMMLKNNFGKSASQLYTQFLYKLIEIKNKYRINIDICLYSPPLFLSGSSYINFRKKYFKNYNYISGFLMNSVEFANTSEWGLSFSIWKMGECINKNNFKYVVKKSIDEMSIIDFSDKYIYNLDNIESLSEWVREEIKNNKNTEIFPHQSSALTISNKENQKLIKGNLGSICNLSNNVYENTSGVYIVSSIPTRGNAKISISIIPENFKKICSTFSARKLIKSNWINQKDEYMAPNEQHPDYQQYNNDAIIYSLFNTSSNQSSMRQILYKDKLWDIKNEFFWMSKQEMIHLANEYHFDELYKDAKNSEDRYVYNILKDIELSPDAKEILELSKELIKKSFPLRVIMNDEHPEYHLQTWDAGWYQIKKILNEYFKEDLKIFNQKYKEFSDRLRPLVYELGFLKK